MKYKIIVEVRQNGDSYFAPMLKKYWWTPWKHIIGYNRTTFFIKGDWQLCRTEHEARHLINAYKAQTVDHTYEIPYKEET